MKDERGREKDERKERQSSREASYFLMVKKKIDSSLLVIWFQPFNRPLDPQLATSY